MPVPTPPPKRWREHLYRAADGRMTTAEARQAEINHKLEVPRKETDDAESVCNH